jgi:1,4-alpha-glucan branching enzyme
MTEFHFDGFRFDGVTSMIYHDHGLGVSFTDYSKYFSLNTDTEAITYLMLANRLIREVNPYAITIAEDMSAMPGMCLPIEEGGIGFDYRLAMGVPDMWIKLLKEQHDEAWDMWHIWCELSGRRPSEKYIGYVESHDQALVGDKTVMFRLCDSHMYTDMSCLSNDPVIDRGIALHKLIRLVTMTLGGEGYLNFMGNEFGHPEWIDFPREGNGWSYFYCRRQWHLADDPNLKYRYLQAFDRAMIRTLQKRGLFSAKPECIFIDAHKQVLVYKRKNMIFALNFHPTQSYEGYYIKVPTAGKYRVLLSTDSKEFGGWNRISEEYRYSAQCHADGSRTVQVYLPARSGLCLIRTR